MLTERAKVVAIDTDCIWVETSNDSVCGTCSAQNGCGQSLLARWVSRNGYLRVSLNGRNPDSLRINDQVKIGIPEDVVVKSAVMIYLLPLILLVAGAAIGHELSAAEWVSVAGAIFGLALGALGVMAYSLSVKYKRHYQPVLLQNVVVDAQSYG